MINKLFLFGVLFVSLFINFVISPKVFSLMTDGCDSCPPICSFNCNELLQNRSTTVGDIDWFNITFPLTCNITIQVKPNETAGGYNLTAIWDSQSCSSSNNCYQSATGTSITCQNTSLFPGTYYFKVGHFADAASYYNLSLNCGVRCDSCPPDDGCTVGCNNKLFNLSNPVKNIDWMKFSIPSNRNIFIEARPSTGGWYNLTLYQDPLSCSGFSQYRGGALNTIVSITNNSLPPGTYYLKVGHFLGSSTYDFNLTCSKVAENNPCLTGDDCQSNVCINGLCRSCNQDNEQCSIGVQNGLCVLNSSNYNFTYNGWNFLVGDRETNPSDVALNGTHFWIVGHAQDTVYRYSASGNFEASEFYVGSQEGNPEGIEFNGTHFWIVGYAQDTIYRYNRTGNYDSSWSCNVAGQETHPNAVRYNGSHFWVTGSDSDAVHRYVETSTSCTYQATEFSTGGVGEAAPDGLVYEDNHFYMEGVIKKIVFRYTNGNYDWWNFSVNPPSPLPYGLDFDRLYFYVVDYTSADNNDRVYRFDPPKDCDSDEVCYDGSNYTADCSTCNDNDACDSDVDSLGYSRDGSCQGSTCCLFTAACDLDSPDCDVTDSCISASGGWRDYNDNSLWDTSTNEDCTSSCTCSQTYTTGDNDLLQTSCTNCVGAGRWNMGGDVSNCCSDDSNEYPLNSNYHSSIENPPASSDACCNLNNKCVHNNLCYANAATTDVNGDGDLDYCNSGTWLDCIDSSQCNAVETCQSNDCVVSNYLIIQSTILSYWDPFQTKWIEATPDVTPLEGSNRTMNVTVNVQNSTTINSCTVRIFNATGSYLNPTMSFTGTIRNIGSQIQCNCTWNMEYWRNPGQWNVSVNMTLSTGISNFTSKNFTYIKLVSLDINVTGKMDCGTWYPGERVNSINS